MADQPSELRDRIAKVLREAFDRWILAEWICCEPLKSGHGFAMLWVWASGKDWA